MEQQKIIEMEGIRLQIKKKNILNNLSFSVFQGETISLLGENGSGKTLLGELFAHPTKYPFEGKLALSTEKIGYLSFEEAQRLLDAEREKDDSDLTNGAIYQGIELLEYLRGSNINEDKILCNAKKLNLTAHLHRGIRFLSNGEFRKAIMLRLLLSDLDLIIFDEPFEGVDIQSVAAMKEMIKQNSAGQTHFFIFNHFNDVPLYSQRNIFLDEGSLLWEKSYDEAKESLAYTNESPWDFLHGSLAPQDQNETQKKINSSTPEILQPIISMKNIDLQYHGKPIFTLDRWEVNRGEQWLIYGPNGSGKSSLLGMISGDNVKAYGQEMTILGYKKGSGESVWDIKKGLGWVSRELHQQYRVNIPLVDVVISGYFDSIGLYEKPSPVQIEQAKRMLSLAGFTKEKIKSPFRECSYGEQRLTLLLRALIKLPTLLILDEPTQGLDDHHRIQFQRGLEQLLNNIPITTLYVTHRAEEIPPWLTHQLIYTPKPSIKNEKNEGEERGYIVTASSFRREMFEKN